MELKKWIPPIPREHGAWVMWILPWCMGVAVVGRFTFETVALGFTCAALFCLRSAMVALIKRWRRGAAERKELVIPVLEYLALASVFAAPFYRHLGGMRVLLPITVAFFTLDVFLVARRLDKRFVYEIVGIAALTFSGPAAIYVSTLSRSPLPPIGKATVPLVPAMLTLWLLTLLYFVGTVFHVRLLKAVIVRRETSWNAGSKMIAGAPSLVHLCVSVAGLAVCGGEGWLPRAAWIVPIPSLIKLIYFLTHLIDAPINLRRSGKWEIAHSLLFAVLGVGVMRF